MKGNNETRVYRFNDHKNYDSWDLEHSGYYFVTGRDIYGKEESYYFKPFFHETARHGILVFEIANYLKKYHNLKFKTYLSRKPDIVIEIGEKKWAIEVETGIVLKKNKKQFLEKLESLKFNYGRGWFFVITDRNLIKSYRRYGKTFTKRNIIKQLDKIAHYNYDD